MKFKINTGEFRHPIQIGKNIHGKTDDDGIPIDTWECMLQTKAKVTNVKLDEMKIAEGEGDIEIKNFYIRFNNVFYFNLENSINLNKPDFIKFGNKIYKIKGIDDVENAGMILHIKGELRE